LPALSIEIGLDSISLSGTRMNAILLPSLLLVCAADGPPPEPKLPLGKETTFVTGPLDRHGYIDYEAALNAEYSKGVTPETNANALLIQVFGPTPEGAEMPPAFYKWLDVLPPPKDGEYFLSIGTFNQNSLRLSDAQLEALGAFQGRASQQVWVPKDCVPLAEWLKANEKPLALVHEAVKRPHYFNPLVSRRKEGEGSNLISALLPTVQKCRGVAAALTTRATLRIGEKKYDDAWKDIIACHRLGRLVSRGATLIESLVGIAICQIASNATLVYLERAALTSEQALERLKELDALPPMMPMVDKIGVGERMVGLDAIQVVRRGGTDFLGVLFDPNNPPTKDDLKALELVDWAPVMQTVNKWYDRQAAALRLKDRAEREREFNRIDEELGGGKKIASSMGEFLKLVKARDPDKELGTKIGNTLAGTLLPAVRRVQVLQDRSAQVARNLRVAIAMAAYRADNNRYPAQLADLAPKYLAAVPEDIFNGKPLIYKPAEKGYLFYSVGPNGKDDGGRWIDDDPPGDDIRVKMPLPELKKK
jgi:hypothetical protein